VQVRGYQATMDALLRFELLHRSKNGDEALATTTASLAAAVDAGLQGELDATLSAAALSACGDQLVLRYTLVSGASNYELITATLTIP
jgi:hypothetical protein